MANYRWGSAVFLLALLTACGGVPRAGEVAQTQPASPTAAPATTAAGGGAATCPDAQGPIPGPIVFGADGNLLAISEQGGEPTTITSLPTNMWASDPAWSPDDSSLLFTLNRPADDPNLSWLAVGQICALDRATGKGRLLAKAEREIDSLVEATWTADGKALALTLQEAELDASSQYIGSKSTIARYDLQTNTLQPLVEHGSSPALSSDGALLSFLATNPETATTSLMVAEPTGEEARSLLPSDARFGLISAPRWSPTGGELVFTASGSEEGRSPSSTPRVSLVERLLGINVAAAHGAPSDLWVIDANGKELRKVTTESLDDPRAAWSPDGKHIAYVVGGGGVFLLEIATGAVSPLTDKGNYGGIAWVSQ